MNTTFLAHDQAVFASSEDEPQRGTHKLSMTAVRYNMNISQEEAWVLAFKG
jgi:hypothetical protein